MKNPILPILLMLCIANTISAKNYYVSAAGNNSNSGLSQTAAWQSISKVNSFFSSIAAGDSILFRRGDTFYGAIVVNKSGTSALPIVISAYGTGAKPIISGFKTLTGWVQVSNGVYQAIAPGVKTSLNMVTLNNVPQALGRYPNADAADGGYLSYESYSGSTSITDNQLTSATNWTGAEAVIRKKLYVLDRCNITAHSGGTITYTNTNGSTAIGTTNFGYFIQNDLRTLDQLGEWYLNKTTKYLQMYFGTATPSNYTVKVSTLDTLLTLITQNYININNIAFEGANGNTIYSSNCNTINIQNCDISNAGYGGIYTISASNLLIENCTTNNILSNAIQLNNWATSNSTIRGCTVKNTGTLPGMGFSNGSTYKGITATVLSNLLMEYNKIDTTGYVALQFQGSNVTVKNNVVNYFDFVVDDAGGIYSYASGTDANPGTLYTNRVVRDNIVMNGAGAPNGRFSSTLFASGIYLDGRTMNVTVLNNTVFNNAKNGIHCNNPNAVTVSGNTSFNNLNAMSIARWAWGSVNGLSIKNNIFYTKTEAQRSFYYTNTALNEPVTSTVDQTLQSLGNIDTNYYSMISPVSFNFEIYATSGGSSVPTSPASLNSWKSFSYHDIKSKLPAKLPVKYILSGLVGSNLFTNGSFTSNISGLTTYGTNITSSWDNTGKISGGALKISFSSPIANKYSVTNGPIGAVSAAKNYILRFSTYGTTDEGIVRSYLRKTVSPYTNLVATQTRAFGTGRTDHEFLFAAPTTDAGGSIVIELEQNSGTTYIDNISFNEANATVMSTDDQLRFEYNPTKVSKIVSLDANYTGVDGTAYSGAITLQPFTSLILVKDTGAAVLKATATAPAIACFGGTATVTVVATGGTAPYTGTGSFSTAAGTYNYTVKDASGKSVTASVTVTQPAVVLKATITAGTITVAGGTTSVTVAATGGTVPYTGTGSFTVTAGTYNYTVTDSKGCTSPVSATITDINGALKTASASTVAISCFGSTGAVTVSASGGKSPYIGTGSFSVGAGKGALKLAFPTSVAGTYTSMYYSIGNVSSAKNYVFRFSTVGTTGAGKVRAAIRQTYTPWSSITAKQTGTFGTARKDHEFIFKAPPTQVGASFMIDIDQASGTTYIDNIAFFESDSAGNLTSANLYAANAGQFETDITKIFVYSTNSNQVASWDNTSKISATSYFAVTDANNATTVATVATTQPASALGIAVSAGVISVLGGTTTAVISATGGTAPYTGTGSLLVLAGTYTYKVTDAKGCTASKTVTIGAVALKPSGSTTTTTSARVAVGASNSTITDNKALTLTAYPNPTTTSFSLLVEGGSTDKVAIVVYSFDGKVVYQTTGNSNMKYSFGSNLMAGIYVAKVIQGTSIETVKLIKSN